MPEAVYPSIAKDAWIGGNVNVQVKVDENGRVTDAVVDSGPGATCPTVSTPVVNSLREAATAAASQATFSPAMTGSKPVPSVSMVTVEFKLEGTPPRSRTISGGVLNGKATSLPTPAYPAAAKAVNASGTVTVQVMIAEDGSIYSAQAVSGHPLLRSVSVKAACSAAFSPVLLQGEPVKISGVITYNFNL